MKTRNNTNSETDNLTPDLGGDPNFSVILPGKCNCRCAFCFWEYEKSPDDWTRNLIKTVHSLPKEYVRCSISGGEPTLSPVFDGVVDLIASLRDWEAIVLTTNGTMLSDRVGAIRNINHLNISRHHHDEKINQGIFKTKSVPGKDELSGLFTKVNNMGIDVNLNCVLCDQFNGRNDVEEFISFAKDMGVQSICFRQDQVLNSTEMPKEMKWFDDIVSTDGWACDVCKIYNQIIGGIRCTWKAAYAEPSVTTGAVYELVYHQNGILSSDWGAKNVINLSPTPALLKQMKRGNRKPTTQHEDVIPSGTRNSSGRCGNADSGRRW